MKIVILAGGQGTKLWPYSRSHKPKQFQPVLGDKSLFTDTIDTLPTAFPAEDIFISTKQKFIKYASEQAPRIPLRNYLVEPNVAKDRGPAEGFVMAKLSLLHPDEPFFFVQSDCIRKPKTAFIQMIKDAEKLVTRDRKLLTGGIKVTEPNMGADYLKLGEQVKDGTGQEVYEIEEFIYRGNSYAETKELIENYHVVGHPAHYCWYPNLMLEAYKKYRPDWYDGLMKMRDAMGKPGEDEAIEKIFESMEKGPTEEVTRHVLKNGHVILLPFRWTDIGTWGSVYEFFAGQPGDVYKDGRVVTVDASDSLVKVSNPHKLVALAGVDNLVVVDTDDVLMIIPKNKIEKIKDIQKQLANEGDKDYL
jgi:mannose-1-phosphate guanylyltransferase